MCLCVLEELLGNADGKVCSSASSHFLKLSSIPPSDHNDMPLTEQDTAIAHTPCAGFDETFENEIDFGHKDELGIHCQMDMFGCTPLCREPDLSHPCMMDDDGDHAFFTEQWDGIDHSR